MPTLDSCPACGKALDPRTGMCHPCLLANAVLSGEPMPGELGHLDEAGAIRVRYIGDYEIVDQIGRGGMGVVFRARQLSLNREVALKLLTSGACASEAMIRRFKAEAEMAAALRHPNIVTIYEIGEHDGEPYFAMEHVNGPSLDKLRDRDKLPVRTAVEMVLKLARAVHFAHQRGVIHRDLKPSNVLLDASGEPHLTDFGIAKLLDFDSTLTHTNALLGTPSYIAPEIARGDTKLASIAVDVYGLGAVLYYLVTGNPPFAGGTSMATLRQVVDTPPRKPSIFNSQIGLDLETVILKCLEKDPAARYLSAQEAADDLARWLRGEPIHARPVGVMERCAKWIRRHPVYSILFLLLALSWGGGSTGILWQWRRAELEKIEARTQREFAREQQRVAEMERKLAARQAYAADISLAQKLIAQNERDQAEELLLRQIPKPGDPDQRGIEWRFLWHQLYGMATRSWSAKTSGIQIIQSAGTNSTLTLEENGSICRLREGESGALLASCALPDPAPAALHYSAEKQQLLVGMESGVFRLIDFPTGRIIWSGKRPGPIRQCVFSPDGSMIAISYEPPASPAAQAELIGPPLLINVSDIDAALDNNGPQIELIDPATGESRSVFLQRGGSLLAFAPDNSYLLASGKALLRFPLPEGLPGYVGTAAAAYSITALAVRTNSHGEHLVLLGGKHGDLSVINFNAQIVTGPLLIWAQRGKVLQVGFAGEDQFFSLGSDHRLKLWKLNGQQELRSVGIPSGAAGAARAGNGIVVAFQNEVRVYDAAAMASPVARGFTNNYASAIFSEDGRYAAAQFREGEFWFAQVHDFRTGREIARLPGHYNPIRFSGDQLFLARRAHFMGPNEMALIQWNFVSGKTKEMSLDPAPQYQHYLLSPNSQWIATREKDGTLRLWSIRSGERLAALPREAVDLLAFSPDSKHLLTAGRPNDLQVWSVPNLELAFNVRTSARVFSAGFSPDARLIALGCSDSVQVHEFSPDGNVKFSIRSDQAVGLASVFSPNGLTLAVPFGRGAHARLFDLQTEREMLAFSPETQRISFVGDAIVRWYQGRFEPLVEMQFPPSLEQIDASIAEARLR